MATHTPKQAPENTQTQILDEQLGKLRQLLDDLWEENARLLHWLGQCYLEGVTPSAEQARTLMDMAAQRGYMPAQQAAQALHTQPDNNNINNYNINYNDDAKERVQWLEDLTASGDIDARCKLGYCYLRGSGVPQNYEQAHRHFEAAMQAGSAEAAYRLGLQLFDGVEGQEQDYTKAVDYFRKASSQGHLPARTMLGYCYSCGLGVEKNEQTEAEGLVLMRDAADHGDDNAQLNMADAYFRGDLANSALEPDDAQAAHYLFLAARQGNITGQLRLGDCYFDGIGVHEDKHQAFLCWMQAALQNDGQAQCRIADCYLEGEGVEENLTLAANWYRNAAEQGYAPAECSLGACYLDGMGLKQSYALAFKWFQRAAHHGHPEGACFLGKCYHQGWGATQSYEKAIEWYEKAADWGDGQAMYDLAKMYELGDGCTADHNLARHWYHMAYRAGNREARDRFGKTFNY